jgi:sporulation protein YlmC with PRC-barrel domain
MRLSDLLGREVWTEDGRRLGRVYDVRVEERPDRLAVIGLLVGPRAWWRRMAGNVSRRDGVLVPWAALRSLDGPRIVVGPDVREHRAGG